MAGQLQASNAGAVVGAVVSYEYGRGATAIEQSRQQPGSAGQLTGAVSLGLYGEGLYGETVEDLAELQLNLTYVL